MAQWVKDLALALLWLGFEPWELPHAKGITPPPAPVPSKLGREGELPQYNKEHLPGVPTVAQWDQRHLGSAGMQVRSPDHTVG